MRAVFDLGGVLVELDADWPRRVDLNPPEAREWLFQSALFLEFERGRVGHERLFAAMGAHFDREPAACQAAFTAWVVGLLDGATALLEQVPNPACLSNTNGLHWAVFDPGRRLRRHLSTILASHHLGARKPDPEIFERAEALLGTSDVLFLDDSQANVEAARRHGWMAERVCGVEEARAVLDSHGLLGVH